MVDQTAQIYRQRRTSASPPTSPQNAQLNPHSNQPGWRGPGNQYTTAPAVRSPDGPPGPQLFRYGSTTAPRSISQTLSPEFFGPPGPPARAPQPRIQVDRPGSGKSSKSFNYDDSEYDSHDDNRRKERSRNRKSDRSKSRSTEKEKKTNVITGGSAAKNAGKLGTIFGLAALLDGLGDI